MVRLKCLYRVPNQFLVYSWDISSLLSDLAEPSTSWSSCLVSGPYMPQITMAY